MSADPPASTTRRYVPERGAEALRGLPGATVAQEHRGQQQREQKKNVIEAEPDVPDALVRVGSELLPGGPCAQRLSAGFGAEDRAVNPPILDVLQQSPMRRVDIEQEAIVD